MYRYITVIKFNLEALGLCPLICQVEIIDAKAKAEVGGCTNRIQLPHSLKALVYNTTLGT